MVEDRRAAARHFACAVEQAPGLRLAGTLTHGLTTRYDRSPENVLAAIKLAAIRIKPAAK